MTTASYLFTDRRHGDLSIDDPDAALGPRRSAIHRAPWTWLRQVHGAQVVTVTAPGEHAGAEADAAVTAVPGAVLAVQTADCAPVVFLGAGVVGVAHAGWRGLAEGVLGATASAMAALGGPPTRAILGPCIRARCYEFGDRDLAVVADRLGPSVRSSTGWGTPALDLSAGVAAACAALGIDLDDDGTCTACSPQHWSFRARGESGRQAGVAWLAP